MRERVDGGYRVEEEEAAGVCRDWVRETRGVDRCGLGRVTLEARSRPGLDAALPDEIRLVRA
jgi:hypothetical protein